MQTFSKTKCSWQLPFAVECWENILFFPIYHFVRDVFESTMCPKLHWICVLSTRLGANRFSRCVCFVLFIWHRCNRKLLEWHINGLEPFLWQADHFAAFGNGEPRWGQEMNGKRCFQWIRLRWLVNIIYSAGKCAHRKGHFIRRFRRFTYVLHSSLFRFVQTGHIHARTPETKRIARKNAKLVKNKHTSGFLSCSFSVYLFLSSSNRR